MNLYWKVIILILASQCNFCLNLGNPQGLGPTGLIYANYRIGISPAHNKEKLPINFKLYKSCIERRFFWSTTGEANLEAIVASSQISRIHSIDREVKNIALVYTEICTIIRGE